MRCINDEPLNYYCDIRCDTTNKTGSKQCNLAVLIAYDRCFCPNGYARSIRTERCIPICSHECQAQYDSTASSQPVPEAKPVAGYCNNRANTT